MGNSPETRSTMEPEIFEVGPRLEKGDIVEITWKDSHAIYGWHELEGIGQDIEHDLGECVVVEVELSWRS